MLFSALALPHVILQRELGWGLDDHAMRAGFHRLVDILYGSVWETFPKAWSSSDDERWGIAIGRYEGMETCSYG